MNKSENTFRNREHRLEKITQNEIKKNKNRKAIREMIKMKQRDQHNDKL